MQYISVVDARSDEGMDHASPLTLNPVIAGHVAVAGADKTDRADIRDDQIFIVVAIETVQKKCGCSNTKPFYNRRERSGVTHFSLILAAATATV